MQRTYHSRVEACCLFQKTVHQWHIVIIVRVFMVIFQCSDLVHQRLHVFRMLAEIVQSKADELSELIATR
jgi:hypothetical protein